MIETQFWLQVNLKLWYFIHVLCYLKLETMENNQE